jgi:hypothetical protein
MSHLEYQTPFHPGPFASQQMQQHQQHQQHATTQQHHQQATQQQAYATSPSPHQFHASGTASASHHQPASTTQPQQPLSSLSSSAPQTQAFAPAPSYPGHNHSRPPPPQFHDGLMQQAPHFSPAASFAGEWPSFLLTPILHHRPATRLPSSLVTCGRLCLCRRVPWLPCPRTSC